MGVVVLVLCAYIINRWYVMLWERFVQIFFSEAVATHLGVFQFRQNLAADSNHDLVFQAIGYDLGLDVTFGEQGNFSLDYALAGHVALATEDHLSVLAVPSVLSFQQYQSLCSLLEVLKDHQLYIYSLQEEGSLTSLQQLYVDGMDIKNNRELFQRMLSTKKIVTTNYSISQKQLKM